MRRLGVTKRQYHNRREYSADTHSRSYSYPHSTSKGNPPVACTIANGQGILVNSGTVTCQVTSCNSGYHADSTNSSCVSNTQSCTVTNGSGSQTWSGSAWGSCLVSSCNTSYHADGTNSSCVSNTQSCQITNGSGTETWNGSAWGTCVVNSCNSSYHSSGSNSCVSNTQSCPITNGSGIETWNGSAWGSCLVSSCNTSYHANSTNSSCIINAATSLNLILQYETSALAAPQSFRDAMQAAAAILAATIHDNITITILVGYGDFDNNLIAVPVSSATGSDFSGSFIAYTSLRSALASHVTSTLDQTFVNSLPNTSSVNGTSGFYVPSAVEKALGLISPTAPGIDGAIGVGTGIPTANLVGVALHEIGHAMGREPGAGTFDLGRYTSAGNHLFSSSSTAPAAYFSIDGGVTKLADYGQNSDPSDFLNGGVQGPNDPYNEFYSGSTVQTLTTVDIQLLDALGFNIN
jgi:hypothetical protein